MESPTPKDDETKAEDETKDEPKTAFHNFCSTKHTFAKKGEKLSALWFDTYTPEQRAEWAESK
eukprot:CAMPEP_0181351548 /NCGR_PEP_ID=MMETSP1106-20121128/1846_1 /TAXON_ID=81844 /ORGANISM="Mantoniella antarctica, Strain SL-175" /LENGTH=62 /DNA_ID=CAMNT_0023464071 /DNA_START=257 /DNA_END=445 /DNA_ORIENTATION=-